MVVASSVNVNSISIGLSLISFALTLSHVFLFRWVWFPFNGGQQLNYHHRSLWLLVKYGQWIPDLLVHFHHWGPYAACFPGPAMDLLHYSCFFVRRNRQSSAYSDRSATFGVRLRKKYLSNSTRSLVSYDLIIFAFVVSMYCRTSSSTSVLTACIICSSLYCIL